MVMDAVNTEKRERTLYKGFDVTEINLTKYLFFTGKGGVGKTSAACATAVALADKGKQIMLISTDPASNLQDVFNTELNNKGVEIKGVPNLVVANFDPVEAAAEYRESVIAPYRGKLPEVVLRNMEEQLSGSCTVEIAAFNEFSNFITNARVAAEYEHIIFDTAPTGHTLRMLQLPSAWSNFISENTHGASCLGQLSGLESKKEIYKNAVDNIRSFLKDNSIKYSNDTLNVARIPKLSDVVEDLYNSGKRVVFTMGKGGVGKTAK